MRRWLAGLALAGLAVAAQAPSFMAQAPSPKPPSSPTSPPPRASASAGSGLDVVTYGIGVAAGDYDNDGRSDVYVTSLDGWPDILAANGHIEEEIGRVQPKVQYRQPPLLFRNLGNRRLENATAAAGQAFGRSPAAPPTPITTATAISTWR